MTTAEESLLFACTRQRFADTHREQAHRAATQSPDWQEILTLARDQGVAPLVWRNLQTCDLAVPVAAAFVAEETAIRKLKRDCGEALERIVAFADQLSVDVMLLPGLLLDLETYEDPALTTGRDADLLLRARQSICASDLQRLRVFMSQRSAEFKWFTDRFTDYEFFEYDFDEHHDITMNQTLGIDFAAIWARTQPRPVAPGGHSALAPDAVDTLIMLCVASARKRFFRLKNLCDICEFVETQGAQLDFDALLERTREFRGEEIVLAALLAAQLCLGCAIPDRFVAALSKHRPRAAIVRWLTRRRSFSHLRQFSFNYHEKQRFRRKLGLSVLLPYATYRPTHTARRLSWVLRVKDPLRPQG